MSDSKPSRPMSLNTQPPSRSSSLRLDLPYTAAAVPYASPFEEYSDNPLDIKPLTVSDKNALTPLRAHYLKRELVSLQMAEELSELSKPDALAVLGSPFGPSKPGLNVDASQPLRQASDVDLPFTRFILHHFILSFPLLKDAKADFYQGKLQPFVHSFLSRNISTSDDREDESKRRKLTSKFEKHLSLVMSSAIRLLDNNGNESVVRITNQSGQPEIAVQQARLSQSKDKDLPPPPVTSQQRAQEQEKEFQVNVVTVRSIVVKGRLRNSSREEFIIRTRRAGREDVFVSRRYKDFYKLAEQLRKDNPEEDIRPPPAKDRRTTESRAPVSPAHSRVASYDPANDTDSITSDDGTPVTLSRERNRLTLRAYVRHLLSNPVTASADQLRDFLLTDETTLSREEMKDVEFREEMDKVREAELARFREEVEERVRELQGHLRKFKADLVQKDGLRKIFGIIRETPRAENLPIEYRKVMEWGRISLASTIYQIFAGSDNSSANFQQLKRIHGMMPYFVMRGILKISNPIAMIRSFLDLFLARPFGQSSLLQRIFTSGLNDEVKELREDMRLVAEKINDPALVQKVENYVNSPRHVQEYCKAEAVADRIDLMAAVLRSGSPLVPQTMAKVARCNAAYQKYLRDRSKLANPEDDEGPTNDEAWLFEDLHVYLRLATRARDKSQLIELIFEGSTSEVLKDIVTIFYSPLAQVYKAANISESLSDLQTFINDLIKTVEATEGDMSNTPATTVQAFIDLVARHENAFYQFVHQVHSKGRGLFDDLMRWVELFVDLIRDGLPSPISLEFLLPHAGEERMRVMAEVDALVDYHRALKVAHHERMRRRLLNGEQRETDEDAAFVGEVMKNLNLGKMSNEVDDLAAEESDEEEQELADSSDEDSQGTPTSGSMKKKRDAKRTDLSPPKLVLIPKLVPVFTELIRPSLGKQRDVGRPR